MLRHSSASSGTAVNSAERTSGSYQNGQRVWRLEKYARLVPLQRCGDDHRGGAGGGTWKHYDNADLKGELCMSVLQGGHLLVGVQKEIYENLMMWNAHKWLRVARKGDSLLFVSLNVGQTNQRFRVRFAGDGEKSSCDVCDECASVLAQYTEVKELASSSGDLEMTSQRNTLDLPVGGATAATTARAADTMALQSQRQTSSGRIGADAVVCTDVNGAARIGMASLARHMACPEDEELPLREAFKRLRSPATNWPTEHLSSAIHLCLSDSNFPAFVEQVEKELNNITGN